MTAKQSKITCKTCKYFNQHYIKEEPETYRMCAAGHCVYPQLKLRFEYTKACQNYASKETAGSPPPSDFTR